jgi:4-hydroxy-tetrahydrodipicolinate reductase
MIYLAVFGATGKMGKRILELALKDPELCIVSEILKCDVAIDFSFHEATKEHLRMALEAGKPMVIGTTGHTEEEVHAIEVASQSIPILFSPNFSLGIALCLDAVFRFGKALSSECTIDILETHHIHKKDSPSGTARDLAKAIGDGRGAKSEIAIHSIRSGDVVGEHTITFECGHERIELKHTAHSRDAFAEGALKGAKFLAGRSPGLYTLKDLY